MLTLVFACRNFNNMAGGIERIASWIMNEMVIRGHKVILLTWDELNAEPHYDLNPNIKWIKLNLGAPDIKASWNVRFKRQLYIRNYLKKLRPSLVIGFQVGTFIAIRTALIGLSIPIIAAERNSPDLFKFTKNSKKNRFLSCLALFFSDCITVQFDSYKFKYPHFLRSKIHTIQNPVKPSIDPFFPNEQNSCPKRILNIGRLSLQKNQLFLINSFSLIAKNNPEWVLTLVGEGEYRKLIEDLIYEKSLNNRVEIIGRVKDVDIWYRESSFLAFPSLWEGFPNVLTEAFRQGLPAVGLYNTSGVNELLIHKRNGILSEYNEKAYSLALQEMIDNSKFRKEAGRIANLSIKKYQPNLIFNEWESLFLEIARNRS